MLSPTSEKRKLSELTVHPRQHEFFVDTSDAELDELANDLKARGQKEPVHILPDGTIIRGHRRVQAARKIGLVAIDVVVRHDLAVAGEDRVVDELIHDNLMRRQLDDLTLARCYRHLKQAELKRPLMRGQQAGDSRDRLAARLNFGKSGRQLDRIDRLLDLPRPIQDAISRRQLTKSQGAAIRKLSKPKWQAIADEIARGTPPSQILNKFLARATAAPKPPEQMALELLELLTEYLPQLKKRPCNFGAASLSRDQSLRVDDAADFFSNWQKQKNTSKQTAIVGLPAKVGEVRK